MASGTRRRRFGGIGAGVVALALLVALAGCLPGEPTGPRPSPTPRPTPTATPTLTPTPLSVAFPTRAPARPTTAPAPTAPVTPTLPPTITPRPIPTPTTPPPPELRGAGRLLYVGTLDGVAGIIAADADGRNRRLLATGFYTGVDWAPDGRHFVALAAIGQLAALNRIPDTVDLFAEDGQRLRRFEFGPSGRIFHSADWSPDGQRVAVSALGTPQGTAPAGENIAAWILDERRAVPVVLAKETRVDTWSPDGRLTLRVSEPSQPTSTASPWGEAIWTVDASGGDPHKLAAGGHRPVGWSPDGATLYALGDLFAAPAEFQSGFETGWLTLVAIDAASGARRVLATVDGAGPSAATPAPTPGYWFRPVGSLSPGGDQIALWISPTPGSGTPGSRPTTLAVFTVTGERVWTERGLEQRSLLPPFWSPDGARLAYIAAPNTLKVVAFGATQPVAVALGSVVPDSDTLQWSPDGRWLAYDRAGLGVIIADGTARVGDWPLDSGGRSPSWYPRRGP